MFEGQRTREGLEAAWCWWCENGRWRKEIGEGGELARHLGIAALIEAAYEIDHVSAGLAGGEAPPEVLGLAHLERGGRVAVMDGAGSHQAIPAAVHVIEQASVGEDVFDGDVSLEVLEVGRALGQGGVLSSVVAGVSGFPFPSIARGRMDG